MIGEKLGHYHLAAKIGEGGMGVVYRARDEELNRDVAIKVLAAGMLEHIGKDHLLREAQTASALSHPNICTIYPVGRIDNGFYIVVEFVEGRPFSEMVRTTKLTTEAVNGVPSDFGFAMATHPHDPDCVYIVPLESDAFRCTPEGRLRVYRTHRAGASWEPLTRGLPQQGAYETVLRDGMATDSLDPAGIYFGTRSGKLYASRDAGQTWKNVLDGLPQFVCVVSAVVTELAGHSTAKPAGKRRRASPKKTKGNVSKRKCTGPTGPMSSSTPTARWRRS